MKKIYKNLNSEQIVNILMDYINNFKSSENRITKDITNILEDYLKVSNISSIIKEN